MTLRRQTEPIPAHWCRADIASSYLTAIGWKVGKRRAKKGTANIPAPRDGRLYDLHDVACCEGVAASTMVERILWWSAQPDAAGKGIPK